MTALNQDRILYYDLHIHSCLSPCADDDMTVNNIANMAKLCGLDIIALTDHNSLKNCPAFFRACAHAGVIPVAGVEVCTREEVHVLCLFDQLDAAMDFDVFLSSILPEIENRCDIFGRQLILDESDNIVAEESRLLISACDIAIDELYDLAYQYNGIAIPAHIEKPSNSLIANLGFIPEDFKFPCYEMKNPARLSDLVGLSPTLSQKRIICNSDAHTLTDISERFHQICVSDNSAKGLIASLRSAKSCINLL